MAITLWKPLGRSRYVIVFLHHPGSDTSVWRDVPLRQRMEAMREAANAKNLNCRCEMLLQPSIN